MLHCTLGSHKKQLITQHFTNTNITSALSTIIKSKYTHFSLNGMTKLDSITHKKIMEV